MIKNAIIVLLLVGLFGLAWRMEEMKLKHEQEMTAAAYKGYAVAMCGFCLGRSGTDEDIWIKTVNKNFPGVHFAGVVAAPATNGQTVTVEIVRQ